MARDGVRTALITGATDGVGRVVARALGKDGWRVLVHGRDRPRGEAAVREIEQAGGSASFLEMNTTMVRQAGVSPMSRVEDGAEAILQLAVSPALSGRSGLYFNVLREARANAQAYDAEARRKLGALSLDLTGLAG